MSQFTDSIIVTVMSAYMFTTITHITNGRIVFEGYIDQSFVIRSLLVYPTELYDWEVFPMRETISRWEGAQPITPPLGGV